MKTGLGIGIPYRNIGSTVRIPSGVVDILKKYSTAHLYIPGIGIVSGFTTKNWTGGVGGTPAQVNTSVNFVEDSIGSVTISATGHTPPLLGLDSRSKYCWIYHATQPGSSLVTENIPLISGTGPSTVIAGVCLFNITGTYCTIFGQSNSLNDRIPQLCFNPSGQLGVRYATDTTGEVSSFGGPSDYSVGGYGVLGTPIVATMRHDGVNYRVQRNGVEVASVPRTNVRFASTAGLGMFRAGAGPGLDYLYGALYPVIIAESYIAGADLKALEKWIGECAGINI